MTAMSRASRSLIALVTLAALVAAACSSGSIDVSQAPGDEPSATGETPTPEATPDEPSEATTSDDAGPSIPPFPAPDPDPTLLPVSDEVRIGTLDNGLTYYVRRNPTPGASVELRLVVDAGSLQQRVPDAGSAHFLEHMLFNGTEEYPGNELDRELQRLGTQIGPDLNAYTSFDETVYELNLPNTDASTVDTGFDILDQWSGHATIEADEVVAERGVVREEIRLRAESPFAVVNDAFNELYFSGTAYEDRDPGGIDERIVATTEVELRQFYDDWYRPDNMAVIAVGDLPVDQLERQVVDRFSDNVDRGSSPERVEPEVPLVGGAAPQVIVDDSLSVSFISIDIALPAWDGATVGGERLLWTEEVIALMIQNRLDESISAGQSELIDPFVGNFPTTRHQRFLGFNVGATDLGEGTGFILSELHGLRVTGFEPSELERAVSTLQAGLDAQLAGAESRQDAALADLYVQYHLAGTDISDEQTSHDRITALLADLTVDDVDNHHRWMMDVSEPLVVLVGDTSAVIPDEATLATIVSDAEAEGLGGGGDRTASEVVEIDQLLEPPARVDATEQGSINELGASYLRFDNGATVAFLESDISADVIDFYVAGEGGWSTLDPGDGPLAQVAAEAVGRSGLGDIERTSLDRFLADSTVSLTPYISETSEGFVGRANAPDAEELFALLHLLVTEPRVDAPGLRQAIDNAEDQIRFATDDPSYALSIEYLDARYGSDPHQVFLPTEQQLDELTADDALALYEERLGTVDDLVVVVVGDIDFDTIADLSEIYVGTLPAGEADTWEDHNPPPPAGVVERQIEAGTGAAPGAVLLSWSLEADVNPDLRVTVVVLETIVNTRLFEDIREDLGASYNGGSAALTLVSEPDQGIEATLQAEGDPERVEAIRDTMLATVTELATNGPDADAYERAISLVRSDYGFTNNGESIDLLLAWASDPDGDLLTLDRRDLALAGVSAADVQALAAELFTPDRYIEILREPAA